MEQATPSFLIEHMLKHPELLQQPNNLAELDAREHVRAPRGSLPSPLFVSAILDERSSIDFIRPFFTAFDNERLQRENWSDNEGPWIRESPLVTAVRAGRNDIIEFLLKNFVELLNWMQFLTEDENPAFVLSSFEREAIEENRGLHIRSPLARHCISALNCAVDLYAVEEDDDIRWEFSQCALALVTYGTYLSPLTPQPSIGKGLEYPPRFILTSRFISAILSGMDQYVAAVIRRTLDLPRENPDRQRFLTEGLRDILPRAAQSGRLPDTIREIVKLSYKTDGEVLPLPLDTEPYINPIAMALTSQHGSGDGDALNILEILKYPLIKSAERENHQWEEYAIWLLTDDTVTTEAAKGKHILYFKEHIEYIRRFLLERHHSHSPHVEHIMEYRNSLVLRTIMNGESSLENFTYAVESTDGFVGREWLHRAILCGNAGAVEVIASRWAETGRSLETQLPPIDPVLGFPGCELARSGLSDAVRLKQIGVIMVLLNAGASPTSVYPEEWGTFLEELERDLQIYTRFDFVKKYFQYGFFERGVAVVGEPEMERNATIGNFVRLIIQIARQNSIPLRYAI
ncbi:hypothetical protein F4811DRAFT_388969 [Daldinia bambusicola]|nr:hypothetical protein F4811DRAFT_388969 [Daldinia bambusicola]